MRRPLRGLRPEDFSCRRRRCACRLRSNVARGCSARPQGLWFSRLLNLFGDKEARILVRAGRWAS